MEIRVKICFIFTFPFSGFAITIYSLKFIAPTIQLQTQLRYKSGNAQKTINLYTSASFDSQI